MNIVIAIDGPSGAGKSTVAKKLAKNIGVTYLDTGAMYRAVALFCQWKNVNLSSSEEVEKILPEIDINMSCQNGNTVVILSGKDVSKDIRENHISQMASDVSRLKAVRLFLVEKQREIAKGQTIVMDGREIGTFVFPNAQVKFYLDASIEERARRRKGQLKRKGEFHSLEKIKMEIEKRDNADMTREFAPLKRADDAVYIDCSRIPISKVIREMKNVIENKTDIKIEKQN